MEPLNIVVLNLTSALCGPLVTPSIKSLPRQHFLKKVLSMLLSLQRLTVSVSYLFMLSMLYLTYNNNILPIDHTGIELLFIPGSLVSLYSKLP